MSDQARDMMAKIDRGVRLESAAEMTGEYRENLIHLLTMQADSGARRRLRLRALDHQGARRSRKSTWSPRS